MSTLKDFNGAKQTYEQLIGPRHRLIQETIEKEALNLPLETRLPQPCSPDQDAREEVTIVLEIARRIPEGRQHELLLVVDHTRPRVRDKILDDVRREFVLVVRDIG